MKSSRAVPTEASQALLAEAEVPQMAGVFVVGCRARRVTLCSQQIRALNLVYALETAGRFKKGSRVAVVGAGAAGLTAAAALATRGADVEIFERADSPMHLQAGCYTRWLHPRIYDWPIDGWNDPDAGLPLLNWKADNAQAVTQQLLAGFSIACRTKPRYGMRSIELLPDGQGWRIVWANKSTNHDEQFDLVILAVGFGLEKDVPFAPRVSYWRLDTLEQTPLDAGNDTPVYLISGVGDGGLIDVLRARLIGFNHTNIVADYLSGDERAARGRGARRNARNPLHATLLRIEGKARAIADASGGEAGDAYLTRAYYELDVPKWIDEKLTARARDVQVILLGRGASPLTLNTAIHNRFLVSRLLKQGVQYRVGELARVEGEGYRYRAIIHGTTAASLGREEAIEAHRVVVRHGSEPALKKAYPAVWRLLDEVKSPGNASMPTRGWPDGHFVSPKAPRRTSSAQRKSAKVRTSAGSVRLLATFEFDKSGAPRQFASAEARHYWITLSLENVPSRVSSVVYRLYEDYPEPEIQALEGPKFEVAITSYGDFFVTAKLSSGKPVRRLLSDALQEAHGRSALGKTQQAAVKRAIQDIRTIERVAARVTGG